MRPAQRIDLAAWQLPQQPCPIILWKLNGSLEPLHQTDDLAARGQRFHTRAAGGRRHRLITRFVRVSHDEGDEFGMKSGFDVRDEARRHRVEAGGGFDLVADAAQQPLSVEALAEKPPVERVEPIVAAHACDAGKRGERQIPPATRRQHVGERNLSVRPEVDQEDRAGARRHRHEHAAPECVPEAEAKDQPNVEQTMAKDRVREGERKRQREHPAGSHERRREDGITERSVRAPVAGHDRQRADKTH